MWAFTAGGKPLWSFVPAQTSSQRAPVPAPTLQRCRWADTPCPPLPVTPLPSLLVRMEGGVGEALPLILHEELAVAHPDVVDLVARAAPVHPLPLLRGLLALPATTGAACRDGLPGAGIGPPTVPGWDPLVVPGQDPLVPAQTPAHQPAPRAEPHGCQ